MDDDLAAGGEIVRDQGRHANAEIDVSAVGDVLRGAPCDLAAAQRLHATTTRSTKMPGVWIASGSSVPSSTISRTCATVTSARHRHHRIEVPRRFAIDEIAPAVATLGPDERDIGLDRPLQHVQFAVQRARLLALGDLRPGRDARIEFRRCRRRQRGCARRASLRHQLELDPAGLVDRLEHVRVRASGIGADHLAHAALADEERDAALAGAGIVRDDDEIAYAQFDQRLDEGDRLADIAEAGAQHGHAVADSGDRRREARHAFVDH